MTAGTPDHKARKHAMHNASSASIWLDCALWYGFKKEAEAKGEPFDTSGAAAVRGTALHEIAEFAAKLVMREGAGIRRAIDQAADVVKSDFTPDLSDLEQVEIALEAMTDLLRPFNGLKVALEAKAPLPYEPSSNALADVVAWNEDDLLIVDYKFGQGEVAADSAQLKIYAFALYDRLYRTGTMGSQWEPRIHLAIIQPRLRREALVHTMEMDELNDFRDEVEVLVEKQVSGVAKNGASSLSTCEWCPAARRCGHYRALAGGLVGVVEQVAADPGLLDDAAFVERVAVNASAITKIVGQCKEIVAEDAERFPDWQRVEVSNPGKWALELFDEAEIAHRLRLQGADDVYRLKTPAELRKLYPQLSGMIDEFLMDQGHHVRLKYLGEQEKLEVPEREAPPLPSFLQDVEAAMKPAKSPQPKKAAKKQASKKQASKKQASKKQASKKQASKKQASKKQASKKRGAKAAAPKKRASKK